MTKDSYSIEDLLEAAQDAKVNYSDNDKNNDVRKFVDKFNVKPGKDKVYIGLLELLYRSWSTTDIHEKTFHKYLKKYIPFKTGESYYEIDKSLLNLDDKELIDRMVTTIFKKRVISSEEEKEDAKEIRRIRVKKTTKT